MSEVYNKEERALAIKKMHQVADTFYRGAINTQCHPFIEFCGLMAEYIKCCEAASEEGIDFTQANRHSGEALPMKEHNAAYLGEKLGCIYGPSFEDPKVFRAFIAALGLPFEVKVTPKDAPKVARFMELLED